MSESATNTQQNDNNNNNQDNQDNQMPPRIPKRNPLACTFCRGRKIKCDGGRPFCGNCDRRSFACEYAPVGRTT